MNDISKTEERILECGKKEFLSKGFLGASLRVIVKNAGVTTGAFYGYFSNKEALFAALVEEHVDLLVHRMNASRDSFFEESQERQVATMGDISTDEVIWMTGYVYDHYDIFKLLICHAYGTAYEDFVHRLIQPEVDATSRFIEILQEMGYEVEPLDDQLVHNLVNSFFSGFFEIVRHEMDQEIALQYTKKLKIFYTAGWKKILGLT